VRKLSSLILESTAGHGSKRKHSNVEFAARSIEKRPKEVLSRLKAGHWEAEYTASRVNVFSFINQPVRIKIELNP